jgi:uroporphyrinogen-III synthase
VTKPPATTVIVTRPEPDAGAFAELCRASGLEPVLSPMMEIGIKNAAPDLSGVGAVAFTSANGVRAFAANSAVRDLPVYAVGKVTARAAREAGFSDIRAAGGDVGSLAAHIGAEIGEERSAVLHVAGETLAGDLVAMLEARGIPARRQTLYSAAPAAALSAAAIAALRAGEGDLWVSLFSPRTARLFVALAERAGLREEFGRVRAACLSEAVAKAAGGGWRSVAVAPERHADSLVAVIAASGRA